ncbi:hypothetical protein [Mycobacterium terramassiliense]|nr:hypothetical protein [Mycobacterium terramassiliense]
MTDTQRQLQEDLDVRLVAAAIEDGRISAANAPNWVLAMRADRVQARGMLAALTPIPGKDLVHEMAEERRSGTDASAGGVGVTDAHNAVMGFLRGTPPPTRRTPRPAVQASATQAPAAPAPVDDLGLPIPQASQPVRIRQGTPVEQWTPQQQADWFQRQLGPAFHPGTQPPPPADGWYHPSPNDHCEFVQNADGTGGWREKPDYRPHNWD